MSSRENGLVRYVRFDMIWDGPAARLIMQERVQGSMGHHLP
jgi:hypothetical protein